MTGGYPWAAFATNLGWSAGAATAVMLLVFVVAAARGTHRLVDIAWGLAFAAVAIVSYALSAGHGDHTTRVVVTTATVLWGVRLGAHIAWRGHGHGEDPRYERMLARAPGGRKLYALRKVYLLQAALVWLVSLPVQAAQYVPAPFGPLAAGGQFLVWWGLFLMACGAWQAAAVSVVSPVVMTLLLTRGSGKRLLENHMRGRPGFDAYRARTSGFLPRPPRRPDGH